MIRNELRVVLPTLASLVVVHQSSAQVIGLSAGGTDFIQLEVTDSELDATLTRFDVTNGFVHKKIYAAFGDDGSSLTIDVDGGNEIKLHRAVVGQNVVYESENPRIFKSLEGYTLREDPIATLYHDYYSRNVAKHGSNITDLVVEFQDLSDRCVDSGHGVLQRQFESTESCAAWRSPFSMAVVTPRGSIAGWQAVALAHNRDVQIRTVGDESAVLAVDGVVLNAMLAATDLTLESGAFNAKDSKIINAMYQENSNFPRRSSLAFKRSSVDFDFEGELSGSETIFDQINVRPVDAMAVSQLLGNLSKHLSKHRPCEFKVLKDFFMYCLHHSHDRFGHLRGMWIVASHKLSVYSRDGVYYVRSDPEFRMNYEDKWNESLEFGDLDSASASEIAAAKEAICLWKLGMHNAYSGKVSFDVGACQ